MYAIRNTEPGELLEQRFDTVADTQAKVDNIIDNNGRFEVVPVSS